MPETIRSAAPAPTWVAAPAGLTGQRGRRSRCAEEHHREREVEAETERGEQER